MKGIKRRLHTFREKVKQSHIHNMPRPKHVNERSGTQTNPLKEDPELKSLLKNLEKVDTKRGFDEWRNSFLMRFVEFLDEKGTESAEKSYWEFADVMSDLVKTLNKMNKFIEDGAISKEKCSVKARQCVQEFARKITQAITEVEALVPGTMALERQCGYTKFHMGAVLVRDGFREYGRLSMCADALECMRDHLEGAVDKQVLHEMQRYSDKLTVFCDGTYLHVIVPLFTQTQCRC